MKRLLWCLGILLAFASAALAGGKAADRDPNPRRAVISVSRGQHTFSVRLMSEAFQRSHHAVRENKYPPIVDGKQQDYMPEQELSRFTVIVDGKHWLVPAKFWRNCFDPILRAAPDDEYPKALLSRDGGRFWVKMNGGDGAGAYAVTWHLSANGRNLRTVKCTDTAN